MALPASPPRVTAASTSYDINEAVTPFAANALMNVSFGTTTAIDVATTEGGSGASGHASVLHAWLSTSAGQAAPPFSAGVATVYERDRVPPSHVAEQSPHAP